MSVSNEYKAFLEELFAVFGPVTIRNMFGGGGIYHDGVIFALVAADTLYLKVNEITQADFEAEGMKPFTYTGKGKPIALSYWELPEALYDDPDGFALWARKAFEAALTAKRK